MNLPLQNKCALIIGGSRGIGAGIVRRLAREGAHVVWIYVSKPEHANETVKAAQALGVQALAIHADSADASPLNHKWPSHGIHHHLYKCRGWYSITSGTLMKTPKYFSGSSMVNFFYGV